jgi:hypothetical protein
MPACHSTESLIIGELELANALLCVSKGLYHVIRIIYLKPRVRTLSLSFPLSLVVSSNTQHPLQASLYNLPQRG